MNDSWITFGLLLSRAREQAGRSLMILDEAEAGGEVHSALGRSGGRLRREAHDDARQDEGSNERHSQRHTRVPTADGAALRAPRDGGG